MCPPVRLPLCQRGAFPGFPFPVSLSSLPGKTPPVCPGPGPGRWVRGLGLGCFPEDPGLARGQVLLLLCSFLGLPAVLPVLLGTRLTAGLVRDGWSAASDTEPEGLGFLPFRLGDLAVQFFALRRPVPISSRIRAGSALWLPALLVSARPVASAS